MNLAEARRRAGFSAAALERAARVPRGTVATIESGSRNVDRGTAEKLAGALCIEVTLLDELVAAAEQGSG